MTGPLILLAIPSALLGLLLGLPLGDSIIVRWLSPVFEEAEHILVREHPHYELFGISGALLLGSVAVATLGFVVALRLFGFLGRSGRPAAVTSLAGRIPFLYRASLNKWWFDELNHLLFVRLGGKVAGAAWWFDREVVDGVVNGIGTLVQGTGRGLSRIQTGRVQNYALGIAIGLIVMAGSYLLIAAR